MNREEQEQEHERLKIEINRLKNIEHETRRNLAANCLSDATVESKVEANADHRSPTIIVRCNQYPHKGVEYRTTAYVVMSEITKVQHELKLKFTEAYISKDLLDLIENESVRVILQDLSLRVKKGNKPWLLEFKRFVDYAIVKSIQET